VNQIPPATMIVMANAIAGIATRIRAVSSEPRSSRSRRGRRSRRGDSAVRAGREDGGGRRANYRPPKRRLRALYSASEASKAARSKSGQSSSRKTSSE